MGFYMSKIAPRLRVISIRRNERWIYPAVYFGGQQPQEPPSDLGG